MSPRSNAAVRADQLAARCAAAATTAQPAPTVLVPLSDEPCGVCRRPLPVLEVELGESTHASCDLQQWDAEPVSTSTRRTTR